MWSLRCCFCSEDDNEPYQLNVKQNSDDIEVIANQKIPTEEECISADSSISEFKTRSKSSENPEGLGSDENAPFPADHSYCINVNESERKIIDNAIEKNKFLNENDVQFSEYYGPENFFSADFSRWLRNGNLYIKPVLSYNTDGILKITERLDAYEEFELFAAKKPSYVNNETTLNTGSKPSYSQALKDPMAGPSSISDSKNVENKNIIENLNQGSMNPVAGLGVHIQNFEEVGGNFNQIPSQNIHDMLNNGGNNINKYHRVTIRHRVYTIEDTNNGYIMVNKKVLIPSEHWHTVVDRIIYKFCLLCDVVCCDMHIYEEDHLLQLEESMYSIINKRCDVIRELKKNTRFHCGICNIVLASRQKVNIHLVNKPHRRKFHQLKEMCTRMIASGNV